MQYLNHTFFNTLISFHFKLKVYASLIQHNNTLILFHSILLHLTSKKIKKKYKNKQYQKQSVLY